MITDTTPESWHLSKSVPVALILVILSQTVLAIWFFAGLDYNVENIGHRLSKLESERDGNMNRLVTIESTVSQNQTTLTEIKDTLDEAFPRKFNKNTR